MWVASSASLPFATLSGQIADTLFVRAGPNVKSELHTNSWKTTAFRSMKLHPMNEHRDIAVQHCNGMTKTGRYTSVLSAAMSSTVQWFIIDVHHQQVASRTLVTLTSHELSVDAL